jgi:hypothetical protein
VLLSGKVEISSDFEYRSIERSEIAEEASLQI